MRIVYKTPHNRFYRRFWRVVSYEVVEGTLHVVHGKGRKTSWLPLEGTIVTFVK